MATFRIAVERDFKSRETGEKETDFVTIVTWRSTAEFVSRYFQKGRMAIVEGRLQMRNYTDRDGNKRTAAEVVADNVYFGDSRREGEGGGFSASAPAYNGASYGTPASAGDHFAELSEDDGELPF